MDISNITDRSNRNNKMKIKEYHTAVTIAKSNRQNHQIKRNIDIRNTWVIHKKVAEVILSYGTKIIQLVYKPFSIKLQSSSDGILYLSFYFK